MASIEIQPATISTGMAVTVTGTGFAPNTSILIEIGGRWAKFRITSDAQGGFTTESEGGPIVELIPEQPGTFTITATDGRNAATEKMVVWTG